MFTSVARRAVQSLPPRLTCCAVSTSHWRALSFTPVHHNFPNIQQMMGELAKNPKAMAFLAAVKKDPKIMHTMQELIVTMSKKGYIDLKHPTKQPSLAMLTDSEVRTKLFEVIKLLAAAGVFNSKDGGNPSEALSKIMGLLMPSSTSEKSVNPPSDSKDKSTPKYDFSYDATQKEKNEQTKEETAEGWTEKIKKIFK